MTSAKIVVASALIATGAPLLTASEGRPAQAPAGTSETRYCMRVEALTGSRIEAVRCWTRAEWAQQGVDIDQDWPREGVRTIG